MRDGERAESDVVLLGGGHAHLAALRRFADRRPPGLRLTVISRSAHTLYSGMVAGVLRGDYAPEAAFVALAPLAAAAGARLVVAEALGIDPEGRVHLHRERAVRFDILSIDIGGETAPPPGGFGVKPISGLFAHLAHADATLGADGRIAVVGAGPAGVELALALAHRFPPPRRVALVGDGPEPLADAPALARRAARRALVDAGVELVSGVAAETFRAGLLELSDGSTLQAGALVWATATRGPALLRDSGLACDADGCVLVDRSLRSVSHLRVFAAGDCAAIEGAARPKAGVWAVRAGAVLAGNLPRGGRPAIAALASAASGADDGRPRRRTRAGVAQRHRGVGKLGLALEGPHRPKLDRRPDRRAADRTGAPVIRRVLAVAHGVAWLAPAAAAGRSARGAASRIAVGRRAPVAGSRAGNVRNWRESGYSPTAGAHGKHQENGG